MDNNSYIKPLRPSREIKIVISVCFLLARLYDLGGCVFVMVPGAVTFRAVCAVPPHRRAGPRRPPAAAAANGGRGAARGARRAREPPRGAAGPLAADPLRSSSAPLKLPGSAWAERAQGSGTRSTDPGTGRQGSRPRAARRSLTPQPPGPSRSTCPEEVTSQYRTAAAPTARRAEKGRDPRPAAQIHVGPTASRGRSPALLSIRSRERRERAAHSGSPARRRRLRLPAPGGGNAPPDRGSPRNAGWRTNASTTPIYPPWAGTRGGRRGGPGRCGAAHGNAEPSGGGSIPTHPRGGFRTRTSGPAAPPAAHLPSPRGRAESRVGRGPGRSRVPPLRPAPAPPPRLAPRQRCANPPAPPLTGSRAREAPPP